MFSSCIGSFKLTHSVLDWNNTIGNKFVNELVFVAFWILPVYEVTSIADLLLLNSIEFWSGKNPVVATNVKEVETEHGKYTVITESSGYTIANQKTGETYHLDYASDSQTWSIETDGKTIPLMTYLDPHHVRMITPEGDMPVIELSEQGVMAYTEMVKGGNGGKILMAQQ